MELSRVQRTEPTEWVDAVDPVSAAVLLAVAGGAAGEMGRQAWASLSGIVRRPVQVPAAEVNAGRAPSSGEAELVALQRDPADTSQAHALSVALHRRAEHDAVFRAGLEQWTQQAKLLRTGDGDVSNTISGGAQSGPVVQGRDFSGITFNSSGNEQANG